MKEAISKISDFQNLPVYIYLTQIRLHSQRCKTEHVWYDAFMTDSMQMIQDSAN